MMRLTLWISLLASQYAVGHGGVAFEEDLCVIRIDFLTAHFTAYQPETSGSEEFCEDLPDAAATVFVIDYLHEFLKDMDVDLRIIRDINEIGEAARWTDVETLGELESETVFYRQPVVEKEGVFQARFEFAEKGGYIGIVSATHPSRDKVYRSVFYFHVGSRGFGYLPLFVVLAVAAQTFYWVSYRRRRKLEPAL